MKIIIYFILMYMIIFGKSEKNLLNNNNINNVNNYNHSYINNYNDICKNNSIIINNNNDYMIQKPRIYYLTAYYRTIPNENQNYTIHQQYAVTEEEHLKQMNEIISTLLLILFMLINGLMLLCKYI